MADPGGDPEGTGRNDRKGKTMRYLNKNRNQKGQGLVEYILIIALMGILTIAAVNQMADQTRRGFNKSTSSLSSEFNKIQ
jgi:hypothetical protein